MHDDDQATQSRPRTHAAAVLDNYFYLTTIVLGTAAWILAFGAQIAVTKIVGRSAVGVMWFAIFLQLFLTFGVLTTFAAGTVATFRLQICAFATMAAVFAVIGVDRSVFSGVGARDAMGAGWVVLAVVDILWVLYFSAEPGTPVAQWVEEMTVVRRDRAREPGGLNPSRSFVGGAVDAEKQPQVRSPRTSGYEAERSDASPDETKVGHEKHDPDDSGATIMLYKPEGNNGNGWATGERHIVDRSVEEHLEDIQEQEHVHDDGGLRPPPSSRARSPPSASQNRRGVYIQEPQPHQLSTIYDGSTVSEASASDAQREAYPYKVRARGDWIPRSPSEISFRKGDILHSSEKEGKKWWQVRKADGSIGAAPSNYFKVMNQ
ncbi:hypothetical protein FB45DRAFT_927220 [Roridomyces roridus]|uniref:SH3 domain-containing protein n=1 Tax=Roridomyces roridus TaxID=1738132 RepID=A0AAD7FIN8_9AGAR|nr:hypothetical protein FB45DRAFT_927220 [Roridomyces roridus]